MVDPAGKVLLSVVPRAESAPPARASGEAGRAGRGGTGGTGRRTRRSGKRGDGTFAIVDIATRKVTRIAGSAPSLSADGQTLTYIVRTGPEYSVMVGPTTGTQTAVKRATQRLDAPALSADGSRIAYQMMPRDDWEISSPTATVATNVR